jgi:hypothetical protein
MSTKYHPAELKFFQEFKTNSLEEINTEGSKRIYSLKFKVGANANHIIRKAFVDLKHKCESDDDCISGGILKEWLGYDGNCVAKHLCFRQKNNSVLWQKDDCIVILYGEYVSRNRANSFSVFWNFETLEPIIKSFVEYANGYIFEQCVTGQIEFVNIGNAVSITYLNSTF